MQRDAMSFTCDLPLTIFGNFLNMQDLDALAKMHDIKLPL